MTLTKALANLVLDIRFESLPKRVKEHAKLCLLDWLGAALAGSLEQPAKMVTTIVEEIGGREESTLIGTRIMTSRVNAALANGIVGHIIELDDIHEESIIHPAAPVIPAALAVAEAENVSGRDLVSSVVSGYEVEIRIGAAINPSHYRFWHTTGTCGTFGAAAAAGKILGLDRVSMVHALGIAGTQAAGLIEAFGTLSKSLTPGRAAMDGVWAALLARKGFTGSNSILDAEKGYLKATADEYDIERITENLGKEFEIMNNVFKVHASCGHTHGAIDALLLLAEEYGVDAEDVDEIRVGTYPIAMKVVGRNYQPKTASEAKFSLPYCLATALILGQVGITEFTKERLIDPKTLKLARKVKVGIAPECIKARLGCAKVAIRTVGGEEFSCSVNAPRGYPKNPLSKEQLIDKYRSLASLALPSRQVEEIVRTVKNLEQLNDVGLLAALLRTDEE